MMDKKKLDELKDYSREQQLIYNFEKLEKKIDENNKEIFNYVDKKIEDLKTDLKEGINKLWDKKDIDSEKIQDLEVMSNNNKIQIRAINVIIGISSSIFTGIVVGIILYIIKH